MEKQAITPAYIDSHLEKVHTFDSFGRNIVERLLRIAREKAKGKSIIDVELQFTVEVVPPRTGTVAKPGCMRVCTGSGENRTCEHVYD